MQLGLEGWTADVSSKFAEILFLEPVDLDLKWLDVTLLKDDVSSYNNGMGNDSRWQEPYGFEVLSLLDDGESEKMKCSTMSI